MEDNAQVIKNNKKDKKYLLLINLFSQITFAFFTIFFNIYTYQITKDINVVIICLIVTRLTTTIFHISVRRFINKKSADTMFRISFIVCIACTGLTFYITPDRLFIIFIVRILYGVCESLFYIPYEISVMSKTTKNGMRKFVGLYSALGIVSAVLSPFISGYLIDFLSYTVLFVFMIFCTLICFYLSFKVHFLRDELVHISLKEFCRMARQDKNIVLGYAGYCVGRFAKDGAIDTLLPVLIFMKTGTNYSVGLYSALSALICGIALILYSYFCKNKPLGMWISTIVNIIVSLAIVLSGSLVVFFIYYFIHKVVSHLLTTDTNSNLFVLLSHSELQPYLGEHKVIYNILGTIAVAISCALCLVLYNFVNNVISISLFLIISAVLQILSTYLILKCEKNLSHTKNFQYQIPNNI